MCDKLIYTYSISEELVVKHLPARHWGEVISAQAAVLSKLLSRFY